MSIASQSSLGLNSYDNLEHELMWHRPISSLFTHKLVRSSRRGVRLHARDACTFRPIPVVRSVDSQFLVEGHEVGALGKEGVHQMAHHPLNVKRNLILRAFPGTCAQVPVGGRSRSSIPAPSFRLQQLIAKASLSAFQLFCFNFSSRLTPGALKMSDSTPLLPSAFSLNQTSPASDVCQSSLTVQPCR